MRETDQIEKTWKLWKLSGSCGNSPGWKVPVRTVAYVPLHLDKVGGPNQVLWPTYKIKVAYSQPHCSEPISALTKGSKQDQQVSPHAPGLLAQRCSSPTSQCPRLCGLLSGSNQPAKNTQHTQPSRKLLPYKATFF